uniref:ARM repeat superfamily protein n=1 Tax=Quercus lobata TaxID=97700 RepID=A0A7N2L7I8_QUELO
MRRLDKVLFINVYEKYIRTKALSIVYYCTSMLVAMSGVYKTETTALIGPMLKPWMDQFSIILEHPVQSEDPNDWSIRMEVLKCLNQFVQNLPGLTESEFMVIIRPLWKTFVSSLGVYVRSSIEGTEDSFEGRYDSDGAEKSLDSYVIQLFEFLLTIMGSAKLAKVVANNITELVYYTIAFLQMTEQQPGPNLTGQVTGLNRSRIQLVLVHTWSVDANQFVADEDDVTYSCRVSGALLLEEVVNAYGREGIDAIMNGAKQHFRESQQEKVSGSTVWWRMREATLFALASLSEQLVDLEVSGPSRVDVGKLVEQIITEDIGIGVHEYPFLYARIFTSVAKFSPLISHGVLEHILYAAIKAIGMDVPPPVKVGACRALSQLLPEANKELIRSQMMGLFSSLTDLLNQASDETLHLVLETLQAAIKAGSETSTSVEPIISPIILNVWALHISDPFISIDALEVLEVFPELYSFSCNKDSFLADVMSFPNQRLYWDLRFYREPQDWEMKQFDIFWKLIHSMTFTAVWCSKIPPRVAFFSWTVALGKILTLDRLWNKGVPVMDWCFMCKRSGESAIKNSPGCIHPLTSRVLPYIGPILNKPQQQPDGLVAGSLDLVTMLLKNAPIDVVKAVHDVCFDAVIWIVLHSDDHSEMQNATECLAAFVCGGREEVLTWSGDSRFTMRSLLDAASRLLDPKLESSGSLFVGSYILQLILNLPSQMSLHIRDLVAALVRRMQSVQIVGLKSSLLLIFARLVHMSSPNVEQFIDLLSSIPAEGYDNSFSYVMSEWTKQQRSIGVSTGLDPNKPVSSKIFHLAEVDHFGNVSQRVFPRVVFDHCSLLVVPGSVNKGRNAFKFENMWLKNDDFVESLAMVEWEEFGDLAFRKKSLLSELLGLDAREDLWGLSHEEQTRHTHIKGDIAHLASLKEISWRQKSRVLFVKEGDNNTHFFHRIANSHRRTNHIRGIEVGGVLYEDKEEVCSKVVHFYQGLYTESDTWRPTMDGLEFASIEEDKRLSLERDFSKEEVV